MSVFPTSGLARKGIVVVVVAMAAFGVVSAVQASIPDSSGIVHACYNASNLNGYPNGALRAIDTDKVNGRCGQGEAPVDLATPQYVQNVVSSTVNQTAIMGYATFPAGFLLVGDHYIQWTCGGWVAATPTVDVDPFTNGTGNAPLTLHGMTNMEEQTSGFPGTTVRVYFNLASLVAVHTQVTCYDPRVYGETYPVAARPLPTVTVH